MQYDVSTGKRRAVFQVRFTVRRKLYKWLKAKLGKNQARSEIEQKLRFMGGFYFTDGVYFWDKQAVRMLWVMRTDETALREFRANPERYEEFEKEEA